jgi:ribose 5-phosphate isomerase A
MFPAKTRIQMVQRHLTLASAEKGKQWAGRTAMEDLIQQKPSVIGLGSGSTIVYAIEHLAKATIARDIVCIPTSFQTRQLILEHKLKLGSLEQYVCIAMNHESPFVSLFIRYPNIDITIDGADEIDPNLNAIKGGGACLFQERLVAQASKKFMLVAGM